ncbi:MAG: gliding motility-associated ABC transporter substrate-binding protein GldG [Chlorobi bacterium]|nr:gliding motility-associated ABC transporter substrate-binding protein GldG [Chlorobiota bacterium]
MYCLFRKEINSFFGSLTGYIAIIAFLLASSLFLWVFPGNYNIIDSGYSTLDSFFSLAPWLYLFLVPAITMRLFAEEKRQGTIEILLTRPLTDFQLIFAKFLAGLVLVLITLLPTLLYFFSVYMLGNPVGNIDTGGTWGAFIGLFFLAAIYVAIGLFASSITDNQVVSFIAAMALSFIFYMGFEFIGNSGVPYLLEGFFTWLSINEHYLSISRGVLDLRDATYFIGMVVLFLILTKFIIRPLKHKGLKVWARSLTIPVSIIILFFIVENLVLQIDLTAEKRYSVAGVSKEVVEGLEQPVEVELFLGGELPAGFRRLQQAIGEKIAALNVWSAKKIRLKVTNPYDIKDVKKRARLFEELINKGVRPTDLREKTEQGITTRRIYPGALVRYKGRELPVNFLKNSAGFSHEINLNHSVENIEFELVNVLQRLMSEKRKNLAFLTGHGELNQWEVADISNSLLPDFNVFRITSEQLSEDPSKYSVLIIAGPKKPFPEKDKLAVDQYIMQGGRVMWLVEPVKVSLDSLAQGMMTVAFPRDLNLTDQLFHYGVRVNSDLLQDVMCLKKMVNVAPLGNQPRFTPQNWYYSPLLTPADNHPLSRNLNVVAAEFVSSVDTVSGNGNIRKSVILTTSPYSFKVNTPTGVSLRNIDNPPARELFNTSFIPVGVLLEGRFSSVFKNRMIKNLGYSESSILTESKPTKMIVISDGDIIANKVRYSGSSPSILPLGYDRVSQQTFGNKEFILSAINYLCDDRGIMFLRNRAIKLRVLDKVKLREEKAYWQWLNVGLPIILIIIFGVVYNTIRHRKFSR